MTRRLANWLDSYVAHCENTEAPKAFHTWVGVSVLASVLRRHVWFDMGHFKWWPNFYIILVAPPGIATKTTTMTIGHRLLRQIPGINFGPNIVTWQALMTRFAGLHEQFPYEDQFLSMSAMTIGSSELGSLLNPKKDDARAIDAMIELWDGSDRLEKETKNSGSDHIEAPWINLIGCTTPAWIADNVPRSMIGGGFVSRCIFVYKDEKETLNAWPRRRPNHNPASLSDDLIADLNHIGGLVGPVEMTDEAYAWGEEWYEHLWRVEAKAASGELVRGYLARKQGHLVKTAMVLALARSDDRLIDLWTLKKAADMLRGIEAHYRKVFSRIGMSDLAVTAEEIIEIVRLAGRIRYMDLYQQVYSRIPDSRTWEAVVVGAKRSGQIALDMTGATRPEDGTVVYVGVTS